jgi:hypothetical protein
MRTAVVSPSSSASSSSLTSAEAAQLEARLAAVESKLDLLLKHFHIVA